MTTCRFVSGDASLSVTRKSSVIEVERLEGHSTNEDSPVHFDDALGYALGSTDFFQVASEKAALLRQKNKRSGNLRWTPNISSMENAHDAMSVVHPRSSRNEVNKATEKRVQMRLPPFEDLGAQFSMSHSTDQDRPPLAARDSQSPRSFGSTPLLTPPEDVGEVKWDHSSIDDLSQTQSAQPLRAHLLVSHAVSNCSSDDSNNQSQSAGHSSVSQTTQHSRISLPSNIIMDETQGGNGQAWLDQALEHTVSSISSSTTHSQYIQMVAQLLPLRMNSISSTKPVFESILENIQNRSQSDIPPFITITHAVPHMIAMNEVPTSPPATPNVGHSSDGYFDMQTVFSHAAVVPSYHSITNNLTATSARSSNPVVAPASTQVSVLERYLPPTSAQEYDDFFSISSRSYLVDRLAELSADGGTLLLVYPTKEGAKTFTSRYLGPILEPLLRQFVFYNNLYTDIALVLADMAAIDTMLSFEQLKAEVANLCHELGKRGLPRPGPRSTFNVVHSSIGEAVLDDSTWREAYIHQEQSRLRKNLVEYQKMGGRMPEPVGHGEITHGMLVREVTDGLRASQAVAGGVAIELGVFVIRRTAAS